MEKKVTNQKPGRDNLAGKTIYGFGDSLVAGHCIKIGMLDALAEKNGMHYVKYAVNGATIIPEIGQYFSDNILGKDIATQIEEASEEIPDFICFDGLINDADKIVLECFLGQVSDSFDGVYETKTFCGAFERICWMLMNKYLGSTIFYICAHKMPARELAVQEKLYDVACRICEKWNIQVIDFYHSVQFDTCREAMRYMYSYNDGGYLYNGDGTHLNGEGYEKWYMPVIEKMLKESIRE